MMAYGFSASSNQNAASIPLVHATASRLALVTSPSLCGDRSRMTLDVASYSDSTPIRLDRNIRRFFAGRQDRCARINAPIIVSSTEGFGMSSADDGGKSARSVITPLRTNAPRRPRGIETRNQPSRHRRAGIASPVKHHCQIQPGSRMTSAEGPGGGGCPPAFEFRPGRLIPQRQTTGLNPAAPLPLSKALRQSAQLSRRSVRLSDSLPFEPHGRGFVFTRDLRPVAKLNERHGSHRLHSKCAPRSGASPRCT